MIKKKLFKLISFNILLVILYLTHTFIIKKKLNQLKVTTSYSEFGNFKKLCLIFMLLKDQQDYFDKYLKNFAVTKLQSFNFTDGFNQRSK